MGHTNGGKKFVERKKSLSKLIPDKRSLKDHIHDYCTSTSIHGVKYLGDRERPLAERLCWVVIFVFCVALNGYLIRQVWLKWNESPVIVSFAETTTPVWQVPFPAVTICSEVKSRATQFNFSYYMEAENETDDEIMKKMGDVALLCDPHIMINGSNDADDSTIDFLIEVSPPFSDTVWICKWNDLITENCTSLFSQIITDEGVCYTFNMLGKSDLFRGNPVPYYDSNQNPSTGWTLDGGYSPDAPLDAYPYRALAAGAKAGLFIVMKARKNDYDYYCRGPVQGFKVLLHNPAEFPLVGERYFRTPINQEAIIVVQPNIMTTTESLKSYPPARRQCYFPSERYLQFFKVYTQRNCELECLTNYTLKACGCVSLHMPRVEQTTLCGPGKKTCIIEANKEQLFKEINASYLGKTAGTCDCLPACTSLQYNAESSQATFDVNSVLNVYHENLTEYGGFGASRISIFFKDMQFTTSRRSELFGVVDFMGRPDSVIVLGDQILNVSKNELTKSLSAEPTGRFPNCGGLLGLFCGISLLSIVELAYYITLRFWSNVKKSKKENKKNEKEAKPIEVQQDKRDSIFKLHAP